MPAPAKKRHNKQHAAKGSSFIKFADKLREAAKDETDPKFADVYDNISDCAEETGKEVRKLR